MKTDLADFRTKLQRGLAKGEKGLAELRAELLKWIVGTVGFQTIAIPGAVYANIRFVK